MAAGYIRDDLDMKFFILYVLAHFALPAQREDLWNCVVLDETADYFMFCDSLDELLGLGHIEKDEHGGLRITEYGKENLKLYENRLPSSIRRKALHAAMKTVSQIRRNACIDCRTEQVGEGRYVTELTLSDGADEIMHLRMLTASPQQSALLENNFRDRAEAIYNEILSAVLREQNNV